MLPSDGQRRVGRGRGRCGRGCRLAAGARATARRAAHRRRRRKRPSKSASVSWLSRRTFSRPGRPHRRKASISSSLSSANGSSSRPSSDWRPSRRVGKSRCGCLACVRRAASPRGVEILPELAARVEGVDADVDVLAEQRQHPVVALGDVGDAEDVQRAPQASRRPGGARPRPAARRAASRSSPRAPNARPPGRAARRSPASSARCQLSVACAGSGSAVAPRRGARHSASIFGRELAYSSKSRASSAASWQRRRSTASGLSPAASQVRRAPGPGPRASRRRSSCSTCSRRPSIWSAPTTRAARPGALGHPRQEAAQERHLQIGGDPGASASPSFR